MGVRAVAVGAAFAVWCMSGPVMAAGYTEVWNPSEQNGHVTKQAGTKTGAAANGQSGVGSKGASKSASKSAARSAPKRVAGTKHAAPHVASASGHGGKPSAHGSVNKVAAKGTTKSGTQAAGANKTQSKAAVVTQRKKPHAQVVQAKPGHGKVMHANLVASRSTHPQKVKVAAKPGATKPAASPVNSPSSSVNTAPSANIGANPASATSNPATASSGSLPPIIH
ncbi:hypothetical protein [Paraburkholderia sp. RL17-381-BIF-C]|uniref:hypothetical protein n=1 Tax=Paraburkholderia sp. RL17-381-BIF-C TaxID=3031635 RepID=UPI0038BE0510